MPPSPATPVTLLGRAVRGALLGLSLSGLAWTAPLLATESAPASQARHWRIAVGPLGPALDQFARQAGLSLSYPAASVAGKQTQGVDAVLDSAQALAILLQGSDLQAQPQSSNAYLLVPRGSGGLELGATSVLGSALGSITEGSGSYTAGTTRTALGLPLTQRQTPQSVTVVTRQQLDDRGAQTIGQALRNTPGVSAQTYDSERTEYSSRGAAITNYQYDGVNTVYDGVYNEGINQTDMAVYDHVEVVKGATGLMTGSGDPSATVNLIRKKPTLAFQARLTGSAGSWDNYRSEADISGPLNASGTLRGRVVGAYQDKKSNQDHYQQKKDVFYGILEADLGPDTLLTLGIDRQTSTPRGTSWTGNPVYFSDGTRTDFSRSHNPGTDWSRRDFEAQTYFVTLEQALSHDWSFKLNLTHMRTEHDTRLGSASGGNPDRATGEGMFYYWGRWEGQRRQNTLDASFSGPFSLLGREHDLVAGFMSAASHQVGDTYDTSLFAMLPGSIYDWRGHEIHPDFPKNGDYETNKRQTGAYVATRLRPTEALSVILGTRVSTFKYDEDYDYDDSNPAVFSDSRAGYEQHGVVTPYAGLVYDLNDSYSAYASYTSIYQPQTVKDVGGATLDPVEGTSYEVGLKAAYLDGRLNASLALFRIEQDNVAESVGTNPTTNEGIYRAIDGSTTQGLELELAGELLEGWNLSAGYTYARTRDADEQRVFGFPMTTTRPEHLIRLFTSYRLPGVLNQVTVGGGLNWQSTFYGNIYSPTLDDYTRISQGGYTLVDLMTRYQYNDHLAFTLNANNVLDKRYLSGLGNFDTTYYGEPRNLLLTTQWQF